MSLHTHFLELFGVPPAGVWSGPGRVNLIGDHTDYNEGFVLPFAIDRTAKVAVRPRADSLVRCCSLQYDADPVVSSLGDLAPESITGWPAYVLGVAWALSRHMPLRGFDLLLDSNVPIGAGLSSSAAVETATALALTELAGISRDCLAIARVCHDAETKFVGAPVGLMDQVVSACAMSGAALLLDCRSLEMEQIPFAPGELACELLVIVTGVKHANSDGPYAERRASCDQAASQLGLRSLRDASLADVLELPRARHVVSESQRVLAAVDALKAGDADALGALMLASHLSLRDDFEVSCPELDTAVEAAMSAGAHGARLTGAGFGGSAIALVPIGRVAEVRRALDDRFQRHRFDPPNVLSVSPAAGATRVALPT